MSVYSTVGVAVERFISVCLPHSQVLSYGDGDDDDNANDNGDGDGGDGGDLVENISFHQNPALSRVFQVVASNFIK